VKKNGLAPKANIGLYGARVKKRRPEMLKRSLIGLAVVAFLASIAGAGVIAPQNWEAVCTVTYTAQDIYTLDVKIKIPWWILIKSQDPITMCLKTLNTDPTKSYYGTGNFEGTDEITVYANFPGTLSTSIVPNADGLLIQPTLSEWGSSITDGSYAGDGIGEVMTIKAWVNKADMTKWAACTVKTVAALTVSVKPTGACSCTTTCTPCATCP